jgi:hypothetical protein
MATSTLPTHARMSVEHVDRLTVERVPAPEHFDRVEDYLHAYLAQERVKSAYAAACRQWSDAWALLWQANTKDRVIAVGHQARAVVREFARALLERQGLGTTGSCATDESDCLAAAIELHRSWLAVERCQFLESLFDYWRALDDVVRRHELDARAPERLRWEDGRRLVVLTALLMVEIDRSL